MLQERDMCVTIIYLDTIISLQAAVESNCRQLDFIVLNWNPAQEFYKKRGACDLTVEEKWHRYRISIDDLKKLASDV